MEKFKFDFEKMKKIQLKQDKLDEEKERYRIRHEAKKEVFDDIEKTVFIIDEDGDEVIKFNDVVFKKLKKRHLLKKKFV